ncbi:MAG: serine hydrolase [Herpetosiphonaceae bacterium]|nr:serine hydrolase [Herpetosiphonaceae bacterium]
MPTGPEQQIDHVISHLLPETAFEHQFGPPSHLAERMTYHKTPGVSIAVIDNDTLMWARGFGVRTWGTSEPVHEHTRFQAASISKPIFALAIMRLVQHGQLDLDADVNTYLTTWHVPANASWQPRITLRQILSHSAGLSVHGFPGYLRNEALPTLPQILDGQPPANTAAVRVNILPATQFRYSGGGTTVAQQLVVDVLGKPFPQIMRELILDPLEMHDSTYAQPLPREWEALASTAHPWQYQQVAGGWHVYPEMAAGLWTTPTDLAKAGLALQRIRHGAPGGILTKETLEQMLTPQTGAEMGLGFFLHQGGGSSWFGHNGWNEGFISDATFSCEGGQGAVVMINSNQGQALVPEIMRAIGQTYGWPSYTKSTPASASLGAEVLAVYVGTYELREDGACIVEQREDGLWLRAAAQAPLRLMPMSETEFFTTVLNTRVAFERSGEGTVTGMTLRQDGQSVLAKKTG